MRCYTHDVVAVCRKTKVRFTPSACKSLPAEQDWTPIQKARRKTLDSEPDAAPVRLIVRRVKPTPGSQLLRQP